MVDTKLLEIFECIMWGIELLVKKEEYVPKNIYNYFIIYDLIHGIRRVKYYQNKDENNHEYDDMCDYCERVLMNFEDNAKILCVDYHKLTSEIKLVKLFDIFEKNRIGSPKYKKDKFWSSINNLDKNESYNELLWNF